MVVVVCVVVCVVCVCMCVCGGGEDMSGTSMWSALVKWLNLTPTDMSRYCQRFHLSGSYNLIKLFNLHGRLVNFTSARCKQLQPLPLPFRVMAGLR